MGCLYGVGVTVSIVIVILPLSINMHGRLTDDSKLIVGASVSVHGCLSQVCRPCNGLATCPGCTLLQPMTSEIDPPPTPQPGIGFSGCGKRMNELTVRMSSAFTCWFNCIQICYSLYGSGSDSRHK